MKFGFIFGSAKISGGSYVILQHAEYLISKGHHVDLITLVDVDIDDIDIWHPALKKVNWVGIASVSVKYDLVFATWWISPFHLYKVESYQYAYFVQSIEAYFFEDSEISSQYLAHASYTLGLPVVTEATWIKDDLEERFASDVFLVRNGIRKDIYSIEGSVKQHKNKSKTRCLIEGPLTSNFKNVIRTIEAVKDSDVDEIWLLTSTPVDSVPNVDRVFSNIPISETAEIYRSCDFIVKQSVVEGMFGPPLEMFHCGGTAIVSNVTGFDEYIIDNYNAIVTPINDWSAVTHAVNRLVNDESLMCKLKKGAIKTANQWPDWTMQSELFLRAAQQIMQLPPVSRKDLAYKTQHLLNQNELIKSSLNKYYRPKKELGIENKELAKEMVGEYLYQKQLNSSIEVPTRITSDKNNSYLRSIQSKITSAKSNDIKRDGLNPRVLGLAISNEHIEELWHPIIAHLKWDFKYICSRNRGYFKLYPDSSILAIDDDDYIVNNWYSNPEKLFEQIESFNPNIILMHNGQHPAYKQIIEMLNNQYDIPIVYSELGWFPQKKNIYFDPEGTNANSKIAKLSFEELTGGYAQKPKLKDFPSKLKTKVFIALQLENDTNFFEFNPHFDSNIDFINYILESLPSETDFILKVHPLDHNAHIYDRYKKYPNILIVDKDIPEILSSVSSVIAINSTVLLEALDYPVNIYKCGNSILDNKKIAIEFDHTNLSDNWSIKFVDNTKNRAEVKNALKKYQISLKDTDLKSLNENHLSIRVFKEALKRSYLERNTKNINQASDRITETDNNLVEKGVREYPKSLSDILVAISKYKIISFDVFDTLVVRDIYSPTDVFKYINSFVSEILNDPKFDHATQRIKAEQYARKNISMVGGEVTYDEIYKMYLLQTGLPGHIVNKIKSYEIQVEMAFIKPREAGKQLFEFAKESGKRIQILSDFYMGEDFVKQLLSNCGYDLKDVEVYVSSDYNASKKDKGLYKLSINNNLDKSSDILHIGDNFDVDVKNALECGFNAVHLPNALTCLHFNNNLKDYFRLDNRNFLDNRSVGHSIMLGIILNKIYDNPFNFSKQTLFNNSAEYLGAIALAPLVISFTNWLIDKIESNQIEQVLFLARDGWLLKESFDILNDNHKVKTHYLPASRKLMENMSYHIDFNNIGKVLNARFEGGSIAQLLNLRFNIAREDVPLALLIKAGFEDLDARVSLPVDKIRVMKLVQSLRGVIENKSKALNYLFTRYLKEKNINTQLSTALVDIGYFGSMQQNLAETIDFSKEIKGFYLATRSEIEGVPDLSENMYGFIANKFTPGVAGNPETTRRLAYLEQLFSAPHPGVSGLHLDSIKNEVLVEYYSNTGEHNQHQVLEEIHSGTISIVKEFNMLQNRLGKNLDTGDIDYSSFISSYLIERGNSEYFQLLKDFILENRYNGCYAMNLPAINRANPANNSIKKSSHKAQPERNNERRVPPPSKANLNTKNGSAFIDQKNNYLNLHKVQRLYRKFRRDPRMFFEDVRNPFIRSLSYLYKEKK